MFTDNRVQNILEELKNQAKLEKTIKLISALALFLSAITQTPFFGGEIGH